MKNFRSWRDLGRLAFVVAGCAVVSSLAVADNAETTTTRQILICTSAGASPAIQKLASDFQAQAGQAPLLKALLGNKEAEGIVTQQSEALLQGKTFSQAAHNHLVVIGLRSQDPVLDKAWGDTVSIDEKSKSLYSLGYGYLGGDIGWVESDRNPFLHSRNVKSAPEDTLLVKISGTSEAGVAAALRAFQGGMLNGIVSVGPITRPKTTLLDFDPPPDPLPATLPAEIQIDHAPAQLVGWSQPPQQEYRNVLEAGEVEPVRMWRYKYLTPGLLEQKPIIRWLDGVNRMGFGNAVDIIECHSAGEATSAASRMSGLSNKDSTFQPISLSGGQPAWEAPQIPDEVSDSTWKIIVTSSGPYLILSTLPREATSAVIAALPGK